MTEQDGRSKARSAATSIADGAKQFIKRVFDHDNPDVEAVERGTALTGLAGAISGWAERAQKRQAHRQRLFKSLEEISDFAVLKMTEHTEESRRIFDEEQG